MELKLQAVAINQFLSIYSKIVTGEIDINNVVIQKAFKQFFDKQSDINPDLIEQFIEGFNISNLSIMSNIMEVAEEKEKEKKEATKIENLNTGIPLKLTKLAAAKIAGTTRPTLDLWIEGLEGLDGNIHRLPVVNLSDHENGNASIYYQDLVKFIEGKRDIDEEKRRRRMEGINVPVKKKKVKNTLSYQPSLN